MFFFLKSHECGLNQESSTSTTLITCSVICCHFIFLKIKTFKKNLINHFYQDKYNFDSMKVKVLLKKKQRNLTNLEKHCVPHIVHIVASGCSSSSNKTRLLGGNRYTCQSNTVLSNITLLWPQSINLSITSRRFALPYKTHNTCFLPGPKTTHKTLGS